MHPPQPVPVALQIWSPKHEQPFAYGQHERSSPGVQTRAPPLAHESVAVVAVWLTA